MGERRRRWWRRAATLATVCWLLVVACSREGSKPHRAEADRAAAAVGPESPPASADGAGDGERDDKRKKWPSAADDRATDAFFSATAPHALRIDIDPESRADLEHNPRRFTRATLGVGDEVIPRVALHLKGHRSMQGLHRKPSLVLDFGEFERRRRVFGLRRLVLNAMVEDPTSVRETLSYGLFRRAGLPAPRTAFVSLTLNDRPPALYLAVEPINDDFMVRHLGGKDGAIYEADYGCDLEPDHVWRLDRDAGGPANRSDLERLVERARAGLDALFDAGGPHLDRAAVLKFLALTTLIGDFDGYRHAHNYYLARMPGSERWLLLPWGFDRTLDDHLPLFVGHEASVAKRCMADRRCRVDYARALKSATETFEAADLPAEVSALLARVDAAGVQPDPDAQPHDADKIAAKRRALHAFVAERPGRVRSELFCLDGDAERDADGDGFGCMDCDDNAPAVHPGAVERCDQVDNDCSGDTDDGPACPCPTEVVDGATFALCPFERTWEDAEAYCVSLGMHLARIDTKRQARALYQTAKRRGLKRAWIGLSDRATEGSFVWSDGAPFEFDYWKSNAPDNNACGEDCAAFSGDGRGHWYDTACNLARPFVCRVPAAAGAGTGAGAGADKTAPAP